MCSRESIKWRNESRWEREADAIVEAILGRTQPAIVGFEDRRSSHKPKMPQSLEAGKGKEADSPLEPAERTQPCGHPGFSN